MDIAKEVELAEACERLVERMGTPDAPKIDEINGLYKELDKVLPPASKSISGPMTDRSVTVSNACSRCNGACCRRFRLTVKVTDQGLPDWDYGNMTAEDRKFAHENFVLVRQHNIGDGRTVSAGGWSETFDPTYDLWFTCAAFDTVANKCTKYDQRLYMCRVFLCPEARLNTTPAERRIDRYPGLLIDSDEKIDRVVDPFLESRRAQRLFNEQMIAQEDDWKKRYDAKYPRPEHQLGHEVVHEIVHEVVVPAEFIKIDITLEAAKPTEGPT